MDERSSMLGTECSSPVCHVGICGRDETFNLILYIKLDTVHRCHSLERILHEEVNLLSFEVTETRSMLSATDIAGREEFGMALPNPTRSNIGNSPKRLPGCTSRLGAYRTQGSVKDAFAAAVHKFWVMKDHKEAFLPNMDELSRQYGSTTQSYCRVWQFTTQTTGYIIHCPSLPLQLLSCLCPPSLTNRVGFLIHLIGAQPSSTDCHLQQLRWTWRWQRSKQHRHPRHIQFQTKQPWQSNSNPWCRSVPQGGNGLCL